MQAFLKSFFFHVSLMEDIQYCGWLWSTYQPKSKCKNIQNNSKKIEFCFNSLLYDLKSSYSFVINNITSLSSLYALDIAPQDKYLIVISDHPVS